MSELSVNFISNYNELAAAIHDNALRKGFWEASDNNGEKIALMHSELSEALEGLRHGHPTSDHIDPFLLVEEELADCIIRIMDFGRKNNLRIAEALIEKHAFNLSRPHLHGKKF